MKSIPATFFVLLNFLTASAAIAGGPLDKTPFERAKASLVAIYVEKAKNPADLHQALSIQLPPFLGIHDAIPIGKPSPGKDTFVVTEYAKFRWISGSWVNDTQSVFTRNPLGQVVGTKRQYWSTAIGAWVPVDSTIFTWNERGKESGRTVYSWSGSLGAWVNRYRYITEYEGNSQIDIGQTWNTTLGTWTNSSRIAVRYNSKGSVESILLQTWQSGAWLNYLRAEAAFNDRMDPVRNLIQYWSTTIGVWANLFKDTITYDEKNLLAGIVEMSWNTTIGAWKNDSNHVYKVNEGLAEAVITERLSQYWNVSTAVWVNARKTNWLYTQSGKDSLKTTQSWNAGAGTWTNLLRDSLRLDGDGNTVETISGSWSSFSSDWINLRRETWAWAKIELPAGLREMGSRERRRVRMEKLGPSRFVLRNLSGIDRLEILAPNGKKLESRKVNGAEEIRIEIAHPGTFVVARTIMGEAAVIQSTGKN